MATINALCAFVGLLHAAASLSLPPRADPGDGPLVPKLKSDFKKGNVSAQWAQGYPKTWGSEDFNLQFNTPQPDDIFNAVITEDEKYLVMFNGSHVTFVDIDTNTTKTTFHVEAPSNIVLGDMIVRSNAQSGYDVFTSGGVSRYDYITEIYRDRLGPDLKSLGKTINYSGGEIGDFDKNGRMATTAGDIYDLNSPDNAKVFLKSPGRISGMSFSGDGQYISTVSWQDMAADLWNATSGEKIYQYPPTNAQNWLTKISPDNKYSIISLGTGYVQVYSLANLTAGPLVLPKFTDWIRAIEWSPDGKYLATGEYGRVLVWKFPEAELVQTWSVDSKSGLSEVYNLSWLDGGNKISWVFRNGRYMYDFEKNLKWWWSLGVTDHSWGGWGLFLLKKRGYAVTSDGDSHVRFWKS